MATALYSAPTTLNNPLMFPMGFQTQTPNMNIGQMPYQFQNQQLGISSFLGYPGQQQLTYQQIPGMQQPPPSRGQSMPAPLNRYPYPNGTQRQSGPRPPHPASGQIEFSTPFGNRSSYKHDSRGRQHRRRRSISPNTEGLYSDRENHQQQKRRALSGDQRLTPDRSRSPSQSHEKQEQKSDRSPTIDKQGERQQESGDKKGKSSKRKSKKERYDKFTRGADEYGGSPWTRAPQQQTDVYGDNQSELPHHMRVHRQPLYNGYHQAYEESVRRGDLYRKQAKRYMRLAPEIKQQLLPHEDDLQKNEILNRNRLPFYNTQQPPQQPYDLRGQFGQQQFSQFNNMGVQQPGGFFGGGQQMPPFSAPHVPTNAQFPNMPIQSMPPGPMGPSVPAAEREIRRLREHIHTLEGELHKLQKKLHKVTLEESKGIKSDHERVRNKSGGSQQPQSQYREKRRRRSQDTRSPRQTPVIVELNSEKEHKHRQTSSGTSGRHQTPPRTTGVGGIANDGGYAARSETTNETPTSSGFVQSHSPLRQADSERRSKSRERSRSGTNQRSDSENRQARNSKKEREETASKLAHAAAARVNGRGNGNQQPGPPPPPPPPPTQQHGNFRPQQQTQGSQNRPDQMPPYVQQPFQINHRYPSTNMASAFSQHQQQPFQYPNQNYNQSNNNDLVYTEDSDELQTDTIKRRTTRGRDATQQKDKSAEKILDAFERFYAKNGKTTVPIKVKYIPESQTVNPQQKRNNNRQSNTNKRRSSSSATSTPPLSSFDKHRNKQNGERTQNKEV
ncbi:unnamed protein product [Didymodactylos carnosus]|uniref:Uncharacterized protein n=1 Tax=Didymodactylos carnosus TaxID=1234261 RepID=A0A814H7H9_9BILA|nr:unnamed protein product [Didymodactylos carnosus]CAF1229105.1 unnamed protein product [Didymodactylos carnosus]CAF3778170.1 unnamed protein product [Didymodactylos carnosus]CAF4037071.1 unnamed protein product [Didymodactylos carnosus]